jgi:hypothetical protein
LPCPGHGLTERSEHGFEAELSLTVEGHHSQDQPDRRIGASASVRMMMPETCGKELSFANRD